MKRRIIKINEEKCNGCGACAEACHEGAIRMVGGVAKLIREDYCDGLGDCLPVCPTDAISFTEIVYEPARQEGGCSGACPSTLAKAISRENYATKRADEKIGSRLMQWPCQIKLVPTRAPYFDGANLLIAADCTAYAYGDFHREFMERHITLIGCPKLDAVDYTEKLTEILTYNDIKSVTVVRMEVPCCAGIESAVKNALRASGRFIPWRVVVISTEGEILKY